MAISPSTIVLPFKRNHHDAIALLRSENQFSPPVLPTQKPQLELPTTRAQNVRRRRVLSKTNEYSSSSSAIADLEAEADEEKPPPSPLRVAECWRELLGEDEWAGMLDPMDPLLRSELIRYGEMAQACYDAFDFEPFSKYCGCCRFTRRDFFAGLGMEGCGYEVTRHLQHQPAEFLQEIEVAQGLEQERELDRVHRRFRRRSLRPSGPARRRHRLAGHRDPAGVDHRLDGLPPTHLLRLHHPLPRPDSKSRIGLPRSLHRQGRRLPILQVLGERASLDRGEEVDREVPKRGTEHNDHGS